MQIQILYKMYLLINDKNKKVRLYFLLQNFKCSTLDGSSERGDREYQYSSNFYALPEIFGKIWKIKIILSKENLYFLNIFSVICGKFKTMLIY